MRQSASDKCRIASEMCLVRHCLLPSLQIEGLHWVNITFCLCYATDSPVCFLLGGQNINRMWQSLNLAIQFASFLVVHRALIDHRHAAGMTSENPNRSFSRLLHICLSVRKAFSTRCGMESFCIGMEGEKQCRAGFLLHWSLLRDQACKQKG